MKATKIFSEVLEFKEVAMFNNKNRSEIIKLLKNLQNNSIEFAKDMAKKKKQLDLLEQKEQKEKHTENIRKRFKEAILKKYGDLPDGQWESKTLNFKESRKLANQLREDRGEPKFLQEAFQDKFAKLDMDNNNQTDL